MENRVLLLEPILSHNVWGGTRLGEQFGYQVSGDDIGECWGVSAHKNGDCKIINGAYAGKTLSWLWEHERGLFGNLASEQFPLLVKIIDAKSDLSVQVHPDDSYAKEHENGSLSKTECWYILDCEENSSIILGHRAKTKLGHRAKTKDESEKLIREGQWKALFNEVPVHKGALIHLPAGTIHAIKGGILLLEAQQSSDITYRVYDYGRLDHGKPRALHIHKGLDVITVPALPQKDHVIPTADVPKNQLTKLFSCNQYSIFRLCVEGACEVTRIPPFLCATVVEGQGSVGVEKVKKGSHFILVQGNTSVCLTGTMELILSSI